MPYRVPTALELSEAERAELESWARRRKTAQALALRAPPDRRRAGRGAGGPDAVGAAGGGHPLEPADHGEGLRPVGHDGGPGLARLRPAAAPGRDVQALDRPAVRREGARH